MKTSFRAQGASEYLVIVAVVVFIALVAIVLLSGAPGTASDAQVTQSQTYWGAVGPLAISEASAVPNGSGASIPYLKVRNKEAYPIKITALLGNNQSISTLQNGTLPSCYNIAPGGDTFIGSGSCSFTIGSGASSGTTLGGASSLCSGSSSYLVMNNFGFEYQTQGGITKRQYGQPLTIKCSGTAPQPSACANDSQSCADTTCCPGNTYFNGASLACNPAAICAVPPYGGMMGTAQSLNAGESSHWAIYCNCVDPAAFPNTRCLSASFDWGDGTAVTVVDNTIGHPAYTIGADHTYTAAGTYTITATATDVYGSTLAGTQAVTVTSACANDSQSCAGTTCCDGLELSCNPVQVCAMPPQSSGIFGPGSANASQESTWALQCVVMDQYNSDTHCTASYQWGDGTVTNGVYTGSNYLSANHTYSASGTYDIFATGTDTMGSTVTKTKTVTVTSACANDAQSCAGTTCCDGLELSCNPVQVCAMPPQSSGIFGPGSANASQESTWALQCVVFDPYNSDGHCTASYQWGDGTTTNGAYSGNNYPSAPHTYSAAGTYTITGTGTDTMGSTVTKTKSVTVN